MILPIFRNDEEKSKVSEYCQSLCKALKDQVYAGEPVRVLVDDRDIRGGEKVWQHIKRGVPLRLEVGPRDIESGSVFVGRRDKPHKDKTSIPRQQFVETVVDVLGEIQSTLFQRALDLRAA